MKAVNILQDNFATTYFGRYKGLIFPRISIAEGEGMVAIVKGKCRFKGKIQSVRLQKFTKGVLQESVE